MQHLVVTSILLNQNLKTMKRKFFTLITFLLIGIVACTQTQYPDGSTFEFTHYSVYKKDSQVFNQHTPNYATAASVLIDNNTILIKYGSTNPIEILLKPVTTIQVNNKLGILMCYMFDIYGDKHFIMLANNDFVSTFILERLSTGSRIILCTEAIDPVTWIQKFRTDDKNLKTY